MVRSASAVDYNSYLETLDLSNLHSTSKPDLKISSDFDDAFVWSDYSDGKDLSLSNEQVKKTFYVFKNSLKDIEIPIFLQFYPGEKEDKLETFKKQMSVLKAPPVRVINMKEENEPISSERLFEYLANDYKESGSPKIVITHCGHFIPVEAVKKMMQTNKSVLTCPLHNYTVIYKNTERGFKESSLERIVTSVAKIIFVLGAILFPPPYNQVFVGGVMLLLLAFSVCTLAFQAIKFISELTNLYFAHQNSDQRPGVTA